MTSVKTVHLLWTEDITSLLEWEERLVWGKIFGLW